MTLLFVRTFFLLISAFVGSYLGSIGNNAAQGAWFGAGAGLVLILLELSLRRVSVRGLSSMVFGLLLGMVMAKLIADIMQLLPLGESMQSIMRAVLTIVFSYLGAVMALRGKDEFSIIIPYVRFKRQELSEQMFIVDTSAIIDGRIWDIFKINFFTGRLVVPRFVLQELQKLSDSNDELKRQRGRRGVEILRNMQKDPTLDIHIHEDDIAGIEEVDAKIVRLAKIMEARIFTTDYNLSRIATIQGVATMNINDLLQAVKPAIFTGEEMEVRLVKEGKEQDQGLAYTEDGTMIVVAGGRSFVGKKVRVIVTSILPTQGGRIIFTKIIG
ncbi:MAG: TRAM domain-containing protein [Candidatus Omnitrophica bacterium]|nr:TRAM domain-containing protein [Candidatus Omnitrophota bacterium]